MATTSPESATRSMEDRKTSILVRFTGAPSVTPEQYDETSRRLEKAGDWPPKGLEYHVAFVSDGKFQSAKSGTRGSSSTRSASASCRC